MRRFWTGLLLVTVILAACRGNGKKETETPPDARALITKAAESINSASSFRLELRQEGTPTVLETVLLADMITFNSAQAFFVSPDRVRAKVSIAIGEVTQEVLLVAVEDRQYLSNGILTGGSWQQQSFASGFQPADLQSPEKGIGSALLAVENLELVGNEDLDGVPVYHLRGVVAAEKVRSVTVGLMANDQGNVDIDIYMRRDESSRLAQIRLREPAGEDAEPTVWLISFDSYNQEFDIEEPTIE
jgi:hypothetical protein